MRVGVKQRTREDKINVCLAFARLLPARVRGRNGARVEELRVKQETREEERNTSRVSSLLRAIPSPIC